MDDLIRTFDQFLQNSGKWFQAEIFSDDNLFNDIKIDAKNLLVTTNVVMNNTDENVIN